MPKILTSQGASLPGQSGISALAGATGAAGPGAGLLGRAGVIAVRVSDLRSPAGPGLGRDGRTALTVAGAGQIRAGDLVVFCKPVAVAAAVVRRDGRVQAAGHPADHARLGLAEDRLDELTGEPGVIDSIARPVMLEGRVKGAARRALTPALAIRLTLLTTLMPPVTPRCSRCCSETWRWCHGSGPTGCRPRRSPAPGGRRSDRCRWSGCGICCWPASTPGTARGAG
jgi:hypothetical protein